MDPTLLRLDGLELPSDDATVVSHYPFPGRADWARVMHADPHAGNLQRALM